MFTVSLVVSLLVVLVIAMRQWLPPALRIWHVMAAGALVLLLAGEIEPGAALAAIDWNVIAYLFGVFSIAAALYDSGISHALGRRLGRSGQSSRAFLLFLLAAAGGAAALTNDAAA
ncbi:MAG: SLC13 family permease, partial [Proteobacteria bacterium]|nr:SLC13 family permease [Pseudomonadota bacterium]